MSFYHLLPSDAAKDRFPANNAAQFSIPIDDAQQLTGNWEVALAQLAYSNCLYTFNGETIQIGEPRTKAYQCEDGCRIDIPRWSKTDRKAVNTFIINFLNKACKKVLTLTPLNEMCNSLKVKVEKGWIVCFSDQLRHNLGFIGNAFTEYDRHDTNYHNRHTGPVEYQDKKFYVDILPRNKTTQVKQIVVKQKNSDMTVETLVGKLNYHLRIENTQVAIIRADKTGHITIDKSNGDDQLVLVCSEDFHRFLVHRTAAVHEQYDSRYLAHDYSNQFTKEWSITIYKKSIQPVSGYSFKSKVLRPRIIKSVREAVYYLNEATDDARINFTARGDILTVVVRGRNIVLQMDNTLKDILGFDQNRIKSGEKVKATDTISLTRRINYFQIYSNIGVHVRVGDTKASLLTMIPFNPKDCSVLSERHFRKLHYVDLQSNYIPRIDVSIYDDAGALVPFHKDAVTSLTLHFRRKA